MEQYKIAFDAFDDKGIKDRNDEFEFYGSSIIREPALQMFHHYLFFNININKKINELRWVFVQVIHKVA